MQFKRSDTHLTVGLSRVYIIDIIIFVSAIVWRTKKRIAKIGDKRS